MIKRVKHFNKQEFFNSMCGYIESYDFYNEGIIEILEKKFVDFTGAKNAICVNSATNAIFMILYFVKDKSIDKNEVIIPNYGFPAAFKVCKFLDLRVIPVDMNIETLSTNLDSMREAINKKTLAYIHVESNGVLGRVDMIKDIIGKDFIFIEDSAPSMLQTLNGKLAGTFGDVGIYSLSPTKPICCGEGAVILTDDDDLALGLRSIRHSSYNSSDISLNFTISPFLAAYVLPQFDCLSVVSEMREKTHNEYKKYIDIFEQEGVTNNYGAIMYLSRKASFISEKLKRGGIEHRYKYYPLIEDDVNRFPVSSKIRKEIIDLPIHHDLTPEQIKYICHIVRSVYE